MLAKVIADETIGVDMIQEVEGALEALKKGSKLRIHYLKLVMMNNIFRAFVELYTLDPKYKNAQILVLNALLDVEGRKNRKFLTGEFIALYEALDLYKDLMVSSDPQQLTEVLLYINAYRSEGKWGVLRNK